MEIVLALAVVVGISLIAVPRLRRRRRGRVRASAGNPLFVSEMLALRRGSGEVAVPPTIHALLAARIEQLDVPHREVIERAAVEGEVFHRGGVRQLAAGPLRAQVDLHLAALVRKELIRPDEATLAGKRRSAFVTC